MTATFYIPMGERSGEAKTRVASLLHGLSVGRPWVIMVNEKKPTRTNQQNALLWALYDEVLEKGGEKLAGYDKRDLHELCLGEWGGWERIDGLGRVRLKPLRRSSRLSKIDFSSLVEFVVRYFAGHGIVVDMPGE